MMLQKDEVFVKYLEETLHNGRISTAIRTQKMKIRWLSRVVLDGPVGIEYREVFNQSSSKYSQAKHSVWASAMVPLSPRAEDNIVGSETLISVFGSDLDDVPAKTEASKSHPSPVKL